MKPEGLENNLTKPLFKVPMNTTGRCSNPFQRKTLKTLKKSINMGKWRKKICYSIMKLMKETWKLFCSVFHLAPAVMSLASLLFLNRKLLTRRSKGTRPLTIPREKLGKWWTKRNSGKRNRRKKILTLLCSPFNQNRTSKSILLNLWRKSMELERNKKSAKRSDCNLQISSSKFKFSNSLSIFNIYALLRFLSSAFIFLLSSRLLWQTFSFWIQLSCSFWSSSNWERIVKQALSSYSIFLAIYCFSFSIFFWRISFLSWSWDIFWSLLVPSYFSLSKFLSLLSTIFWSFRLSLLTFFNWSLSFSIYLL